MSLRENGIGYTKIKWVIKISVNNFSFLEFY